MDFQHLQRLIQGWMSKAKIADDKYAKFMYLWIYFNAYLAFTSGKEKDRDMINWLKKQPNSNDLIRTFQALQNTGSFKNALIWLVKHSPHEDPRPNPKPPINIKDEKDFNNILEAIYRIRCNLFHGSSDAYSRKLEKVIVFSNEILLRWIHKLVLNWN